MLCIRNSRANLGAEDWEHLTDRKVRRCSCGKTVVYEVMLKDKKVRMGGYFAENQL